MVYCCVRGCGERQKVGGKSFFRIPKNPWLKKRWMLRCSLNLKSTGNDRICEKHFSPVDLCFNSASKRTCLKPNAVPQRDLLLSASSENIMMPMQAKVGGNCAATAELNSSISDTTEGRVPPIPSFWDTYAMLTHDSSASEYPSRATTQMEVEQFLPNSPQPGPSKQATTPVDVITPLCDENLFNTQVTSVTSLNLQLSSPPDSIALNDDLHVIEPLTISINENVPDLNNNTSTCNCNAQDTILKLRSELQNVKEELISKNSLIASITVQNNTLVFENKKLLNENKILNSKLKVIPANSDTVIKSKLEQYFSKTQIHALLTGKKVTKWSEDDIISALAFKSSSTKGYKYAIKKWKLPLPSINTLNRWIHDIKIEPGHLNVVYKIMRQKSTSMTDGERACILSFDEMSLQQKHSYDKGSDKVFPAHSNVQVVMARGILGDWKQPLFYDFDQKMTKNILLEIISKLEDSGFHVHATVCDLGASNQSLLKSLNVTADHPFFSHPTVDRNIHVFADVPHLIKLIRNHLLDHGLKIGDNLVDSSSLVELVKHQSGDLSIVHKISMDNLTVSGNSRQKVKTATQLLSNSVYKALVHLGSSKKVLHSPTWSHTAAFIKQVNDWFDVMNSTFDIKYKSSNAFRNTVEQNSILTNIIETINKTTVKGKKLPFLNGMIMSSKSLLNLFIDLKKLYNYSYLYSRKLNQDILEHFFGIIRQMDGTHDHPCALVFKQRMKRLVIMTKTHLSSVSPNTHLDSDDPSIVSNLTSLIQLSSPIRPPLNSSNETIEENLLLDDGGVPDNEQDGFNYVLGYVVKKFAVRYPYLGGISDSDENSKDWLTCISRGGLHRMDASITDKFILLENLFRSHHGETLVSEYNTVSNLTQTAIASIDLPEDVISFYLRCRIYFRIKILNTKFSDTVRKTLKKYNKQNRKE